jgi:putative hydrolases of HD superfamily
MDGVEPVDPRLAQQVSFVLEADKLKQVLRRTTLADGSRRENSAEHSWHLALAALVLAEHASEPVDLARVVWMLVVHDLVEIDAGDTFAYDKEERASQAERERRAADRLFALLPDDQAADLRALWDEFERQQTPDARFAAAVDRIQPVLLNYASGGVAWREHGVSAEQVRERNRHVGEAAPELWALIAAVIDEARHRGWLG